MIFKKIFKNLANEIDKNNLPLHIAIIMDGNGRWAKKRNLPRKFGHREGVKTFEKISRFCEKIGIKYLTVYAFSTENWGRPKNEVDGLMELLLNYLRNIEKHIKGRNIRINIIGDTTVLRQDIRDEIKRVEELTRKMDGLLINISINYGGRNEIISAVKTIAQEVFQGRLELSNINENTVADRLYTSNIPEPDLLIRTSGEKRISNFLIWQVAYTEFYFTDVLWPDFKEKDLLNAIHEYQKRSRRFGGV